MGLGFGAGGAVERKGKKRKKKRRWRRSLWQRVRTREGGGSRLSSQTPKKKGKERGFSKNIKPNILLFFDILSNLDKHEGIETRKISYSSCPLCKNPWMVPAGQYCAKIDPPLLSPPFPILPLFHFIPIDRPTNPIWQLQWRCTRWGLLGWAGVDGGGVH